MESAIYKVLSNYTTPGLEKDVHLYIEKGFEPTGGIAVSGDPARGEELFYQAMYRPAVVAPKNTTIDKPGRHVVDNPENAFRALKEPKGGKKK